MSKFLRLIFSVVRRFNEHACAQRAASLSFTSLLALAPGLTIALSVFAVSPYFADIALAVRQFLMSNLVPEAAGRMTTLYLEQFVRHAGRLTMWGTLLFATSVLFLLLTLDQAFNAIWRVNKPRPLWRRISRYAAFLVAGPIVLGITITSSSWLISMSLGWSSKLAPGEQFILKWLPLVLTVFIFSGLFWWIPKQKVLWRHALIGGTITALALEWMKSGFSWYVTHVLVYKLVYGAFASLPIFLLWIYVCWLIILGGAVLTACLPGKTVAGR